MKKPDIPENEDSRLDTLLALKILDTPPEERFDRLTRMAKQLFDVPIAVVSLVDKDRQWFKSCVGLDVSETPRDISFCGHAILDDELFIVSDALQDERFADNPLVLDEPKIRFYAGCPLKSLNGYNLGTFCIIDDKPKNLNKDEIASFKDLAFMAERELSIVHMATVDDLTKVSNRRGFIMVAQHSLNFCKRHEFPASLAYFDLNNFKPINDKFGHAEGDKALINFANQLNDAFRESDIFARLGGDEFAALLSNTTKDQAEEVVLRIQNNLEKFNREANRGYEINFSHGIVEYNPNSHQSIKALLADGDSLMYKQKKQKNNVSSLRVSSIMNYSPS